MEQATVLRAALFVAEAKDILQAGGIVDVFVSSDFDELEKACDSLKIALSEQFDQHKFMEPLNGRALWIGGKDKNGKLVALQAVRRDCLGALCLTDYLNVLLPRLNGGKPINTSPGPKTITGAVAYHGQGYIAKEYRSNQLGPCITRLAIAVAFLEWRDINAIYGLTQKELVLTGYNMRKAYAHGHPHVLKWGNEMPRYGSEYFLIWNTREDIEHMLLAGHQAYALAEETPSK